MTKVPLVNPGLTEDKKHTKTIVFMILHQVQAYWSFLSTLTKFDLKITPKDDQNPNFNLTIETGWNQCHCKEYWINFPMTTHRSKSELKRLRYLEQHPGRISSLLEAITFDPFVCFSKCQVINKLDIYTFLRKPRLGQSSWKRLSNE